MKPTKKVKKVEEKKITQDDVIENLQAQLKEFSEKAEYFKTMKLKAEGALEILLQMKDK
tara:strand:+ start:858 stop:1034 length:177 start_codon:yes stop_codon:yes gene_type:complete